MNNEGNVLEILEGHSNEVCCLKYFSCGKKLVSGSGDKSIKVWNIN